MPLLCPTLLAVPACARALAPRAGLLPSQRWSLLTPGGARASRGAAGSHPGPGTFWSRVPHQAGWAGYCSVGSHASGPVMRPLKLLSPHCHERQRLSPGVPEPSTLKPPQIFCFSKLLPLFLDVYRMLCWGCQCSEGLVQAVVHAGWSCCMLGVPIACSQGCWSLSCAVFFHH